MPPTARPAHPSLRLAIAGCGRISEVGYLPALRRVEGLELVALADTDAARRARIAASFSGPPRGFDSVATMLEEVDPDVLVIATPPRCHLEHAEAAASRGVATMVEKPPCRRPVEAARLACLEPRPWVGFNRRFSHLPAVGEIAADADLAVSLRISYRRASWRAVEVDDDALDDLGPHLADLAAVLLAPRGPAAGAHDRTPDPPLCAARSVSLAPERAELELFGPRGKARLICETNRPWQELVEIRDSRGRLVARSAHGGLSRALVARMRRREHPLVLSLALQLRALADAVGGGDGGRLARACDGELALRALDAARRSQTAGGEVTPL